MTSESSKTEEQAKDEAGLEYQCKSHPGKEYFNRGELQHCFHAAWNACYSKMAEREASLLLEIERLKRSTQEPRQSQRGGKVNLKGKHYMTPDAKKALEALPVLITDTLCRKCGANKSVKDGDGGFTSYNISETPGDDGVSDVTDCNRCKERIQ